MCTEKMHSKIRCIKYSETNNNIIQDILSRNVQLNSWQAFIKPWDGFCGPLEVRTHALPPPDSDCVMQDVKLKLLNLQWFRVLGASFSRFRGLRFRVVGASFSI